MKELKTRQGALADKVLQRIANQYIQDLNDGVKNEVLEIIKNVDTERLSSLVRSDFESEKEIALTKDLQPTDFMSEDAVWRGKCDLVWQEEFMGTKVVNVLDFKTNRDFTADPLQLQFYAFLVYHYYNLQPSDMVYLYFWYLRQNSEEPIIKHSANHMDNMQWFLSLPNMLFSADNYPATPGEHCKYCSVAHHCPLVKELTVQTNVIEDKPIEILLDVYLPLKQALSIIEAKLDNALSERDEIEGKYVKARKRKIQKTVLNEQALREYLKVSDIDVSKIIDTISITQTLFKKLGIKIPDEYISKEESYRVEVVTK